MVLKSLQIEINLFFLGQDKKNELMVHGLVVLLYSPPQNTYCHFKSCFFAVFSVLLTWQVQKCSLKPCFTFKTILVMAFQHSGVLFPFSLLRRQVTITQGHLHLVFGRASLQQMKVEVQFSVFM